MNKLLIVDVWSDGNYRAPYYRLFEKYGVDCYYLIAVPKNLESYGKQVKVAKSCSVNALCDAAVEWHQEINFNAVATVDEFATISTAVIAQTLGLPGNTPNSARNSRNKYLMRKAHEIGNAPHPKFGLAESLEQALSVAEDIGYPVILKPTFGAGSQHVYKINNFLELRRIFPEALVALKTYSFANIEAFDEEGGPNAYIIEEYLSGHEHCCEAIIWDDEVYLGSVADRLSVEMEIFDNDLYTTPTALSASQIQDLKQAILKGAHAQGLRRSVLHPELRFHEGKPYILEIASRIGGGSLFCMARLSYGYCPIWNTINVAFNRKPWLLELNETGYVTAGLTWISEPGKITELDIPEDIQESRNLFNLKITSKIGDIIRRPPNGNDIIGYIGTGGNTIEEAIFNGEVVRNRINLVLQSELEFKRGKEK